MTGEPARRRIACVLPARGPSLFVDKGISHFHAQDHPDRVLVVLSRNGLLPDLPALDRLSGSDPVALAWDGAGAPEEDPPLLDRLVEEVDADCFAWWHPLDWMAPDRLSRQLSFLEHCGAPGVCASDSLTYSLHTGAVYGGRGPTSGTALHSATAARAGRRWTMPEQDPDWYLAVSTAPCEGLSPRPFTEVGSRLGSDIDTYARWRSGRRSPTAYEPPGRGPRPLNIATPLLVFDGFGSMGEYLIRSLSRAGARVNATAMGLDRQGLHEETLAVLDRSSPRPGDPTLVLAWVGTAFEQVPPTRTMFINSMWESTRLPAGFADRLNACRAVVVPSRWAAGVFCDSGVTAPIHVVPQGVDPERYPLLERTPPPPTDRAVTTLIVATVTPRKNLPESITAWQAAFEGNPDAGLIIKSRFRWQALNYDDPRISFVDTDETTRGIAHWYARADVVLALGGEGFGLPLVEAMACGLPVVALDAQGQSDVCADARGLLLPVPCAAWVPYDDGTYAVGLRAVPDVAAVADALRWVTAHRVEAWELGRRASTWVHAHRNVWDMGPRILQVMQQHVLPGEEIALGPALPRGAPTDVTSFDGADPAAPTAPGSRATQLVNAP